MRVRERHLRGLFLLASLVLFGSCALLSHSVQSLPRNESHPPVVNVIVVGATGDLAAKYLWVSLFRLASTDGRTYRFFAGASQSLERGSAWRSEFFNERFAQRVCGAVQAQQGISAAQTKCLEFLEAEFKPSVQYTPLSKESHYRDLGNTLDQMHAGTTEEGRLLYLAIPPQYFLQSCEFIHRFLRPEASENGPAGFLRVVVEKPFGRDLQSARELATRLRSLYSNDELFVMDHYAGKRVVHALRNYFQLNAAVLRPIWNSEHIRDIRIEMTEEATLQNRVHYFDSAGIIRDVMVNHLQLLLNVAVSPAFNAAIYDPSLSSSEFARRVHVAQLRFVESLQIPVQASHQQAPLVVGQYEEYATHYREEMGQNLEKSGHFTPTAAMVELRNSLEEWRNTTFRLAAAKAADARLLTVTVVFRQGTFPIKSSEPCKFTVTIQKAHNADTHQSHRIEWSCDVTDTLQLPEDWEYLDSQDHRIITPSQSNSRTMEETLEASAWKLGDKLSAYDILLRDVARGASGNFADLDEVEAAWKLWIPLVEAAEGYGHRSHDAASLQYVSYPAGTSPWDQLQTNSRSFEDFRTDREEL
ncbi:hypothetical protein PF010_g23610 [Phytophthora fragariae]|uniref:Glucose-6-phosphate 1-dehydrogenase n=1 Tax=Phytophthora fragariae TaxID=53985 RepID=A0A6A3RR98_9STRA|nr:hypothetical protein PF003_g17003 [Phytophthora fragariae]KAE8927126.1 hypothetical protein PF009_g22703 [Phytophthora fragariae]KAE9077173.1 hypothetical protein PF010_g23610 [Phytophthora fragariae]KAE9101888.1 hypothetical protein PF006_g22573 [Phytophthora fragariae]KAE9209701.1 hypothetical protein PF002_g19033 [Phytophthora fragariae]